MNAEPELHLSDAAFGVWQLGEARFDERSGRLARADGEVALDRSAQAVLRCLAANAGQVCSREELIEAGWPGRIVTENSLAKCIGRLREALGEPLADLLRVVHGYGYRLLAPVSFQPAADAAPAATSMSATAWMAGAALPQRVDWRIVRVLGGGGGGVVLLAEHEGGEAPRAYKLVDTPRGLRALKREVSLHRFLDLHHPQLGVVDPLLDANLELPPFFVATAFHPDGHLADWAVREGRLAALDEGTRRELAARLCDAVADLHDADIAHRDLKPENLYPLQQADGGWRIVVGDLGIGAGLLPPGIDALGLPLGEATRHGDGDGVGSGSLRYVAPEVLAGQAATANSDLYALGVIVFQLLCADFRRPLAPGWEALLPDPLLQADIAEAAHLDPARRIASAREFARRLRALPARRAARLAEHEAGLRREADAVRARRQRTRSRLAATAAVALAAGLAVALGFAQRAREASARERERAEEATAVLSFLTGDLLAQADPYANAARTPTLGEALARAAEGIDARFAQQPAIAAAVHLAVAEAFDGQGDSARMLRHQQRGRDLLREAEGADAPRLANIERELCSQSRRAGRIAEGRAACAEAARIEVLHHGRADPATMVEAAKLDYMDARCEQAVPALEGVLAAAGAPAPDDALAVDAWWFLGLCQASLGDFAASWIAFERLLPLRTRVSGEAAPLTGWAHMDFASSLVMGGDFARAEAQIHAAERILGPRLGPRHVDFQQIPYTRARIALWRGDPAAAIPLLEGVLAIRRARLGEAHVWTMWAAQDLAWALARAGRFAEAEPVIALARRVAAAAVKPDSQAATIHLEALANALLASGALDAADTAIAQLADVAATTLPAAHPRRAMVECLRGELALRRGDAGAARAGAAACLDRLGDLDPAHWRRRTAEAVIRAAGRASPPPPALYGPPSG